MYFNAYAQGLSCYKSKSVNLKIMWAIGCGFVSNHVSPAFMRRVQAKGVTVAEWALMREMLEAGPVNPGQLAERLGMTRGAISMLVERLCHKKRAKRTADVGDRRYQRVALTTKGRRLVPKLAQFADENGQEFFGHLAVKSQNDLVRLLRNVVRPYGWKNAPVS